MNYRYQGPDPLLTNFLRTIIVMEGGLPAAPNDLPLFTNGIPALLCRMEKDETGIEKILQLSLYGKTTPPGAWDISENTTLIAYCFKPFVMPVLFNLEASVLAKETVELANWNAHTTNALRTQLIYAGNTERKLEVLDNLLVTLAEQNKRECAIIQYATDQIMCDPGRDILTEIPGKLNLTERTFQRIFKKYVGITPTQYRRICQFQVSFAQLRSKNFDKLTDIAFDNGFADQSHFIRSFKEFTHITPAAYLKSGLKGKNDL